MSLLPQKGEKISSYIKDFNPVPAKSEIKSALKAGVAGVKKAASIFTNPVKAANKRLGEELETATKKIPKGDSTAPNEGSSLGKAVHAKSSYTQKDPQPTKVTESDDAIGKLLADKHDLNVTTVKKSSTGSTHVSVNNAAGADDLKKANQTLKDAGYAKHVAVHAPQKMTLGGRFERPKGDAANTSSGND
jgi:hypothetical protein